MSIRHNLDDLREQASRLAGQGSDKRGAWFRFIRNQRLLWSVSYRRLRDNNAMAMSAALSFRTIFAMIPSLVLIILMLRMLGVQELAQEHLKSYIDQSGITAIRFETSSSPAPDTQPATAPADGAASAPATMPATALATRPETEPDANMISVEGELNKVVTLVEEKVTLGRLGPIGILLLIWTALTLMMTVERSLNRVFHAPAGRPLGRQALLYWSTLTLGPILLIAALAAAEVLMSYATNFAESHPWLSWILLPLGVLQPIAVGIFLFAGAYALIPNTKVRFRSALAGAVIAFPAWLVAMWGFTKYVTEVVGQDPLYGTLGLLPLFLFWLNTSWLTFLFGAEIAHTSDELYRGGALFGAESEARDALVSQWDSLAAALAVAAPYGAGRGAVRESDIVARLRMRPRMARILLEDLVQRGLLCPVEDAEADSYVPGRPIHKTRVADVIDLAASSRVEAGAMGPRYEQDLAEAVTLASLAVRQGLEGMTLADLLPEKDALDA